MLLPPQGVTPWIGRIGDAPRDEVVAFLTEAARQIRIRDLQLVYSKKAGHIGGEMSIADILTTLILHTMNLDPANLDDPERDRLVVSKGHVAAILYTTLAAGGFLDPEELDTFLENESMLNGHPARTKVQAVEASTGPLGHGLPIATGMALGAKIDGSPRRTYVVLGDGEMQEGSNWEAIMFAGHQKLTNLTAIVDRNRLQQGATTRATNSLEPLTDRLRAFNWDVTEVDGHDIGALVDTFAATAGSSGKPTFVIANTHKGHPISYMSDNVAWHHKVPNSEQFEQALAELEALKEEA
ncbi:MAG TPA: transketolase [Actinomycetales bacterium]|nr:transketolase [Actinomycetales bacterium]